MSAEQSGFRATCSGGTGHDLSGYPALVHAPAQWGNHVGCHSNGTPAADVAAYVANSPATTTTAQIAQQLKISVAEVLDAVRYVAAHP
jgi:hypothetical protein